MKHYDVIVIGGGPSGMMAAGRAAARGRSVLLLEKNNVLGKKLCLSGGGRCNITNAEFDNRILLANYGEAQKFLHATFARFSVGDTFAFFEERGLPLDIEEHQRAFPETRRAQDVKRVLSHYLEAGGVELRTGVAVRSLLLANEQIVGVDTSRGSLHGATIVLATGGVSYPQTGSTGEGFDWLRAIGHTVFPPNPDLVPLKVKEAWVKELSGTTLESMRITFAPPKKDAAGKGFSKTGRLLFTHFGLSGPLIINSAHAVKQLLAHGPVCAAIDLYPEEDHAAVDKRLLAHFEEHRNKLLRNTLKGLCPEGMLSALFANLPETILEQKVSHVTQEQRKTLGRLLKGLPLTVTGTMGYDWAIISDGGVPLTEIDTRSMASRLHPNLYIVGDLLHIRRPSGGFSLQLCWSTGWVAGSNA